MFVTSDIQHLSIISRFRCFSGAILVYLMYFLANTTRMQIAQNCGIVSFALANTMSWPWV